MGASSCRVREPGLGFRGLRFRVSMLFGCGFSWGLRKERKGDGQEVPEAIVGVPDAIFRV